LADTEISYFTLAGDQTKVKAAKKRTSDLIIANRFKGIILDCNYSRRRFDSQATQENCRWIYNMYRKAFGGIPLPMSTQ
jgi:hypothetical protein